MTKGADLHFWICSHDQDNAVLQKLLVHGRAMGLALGSRADLLPGTPIAQALYRELASADRVVVLLSADLLADARWPEQEALIAKRRSATVQVLQVRPCEAPATLRRLS